MVHLQPDDRLVRRHHFAQFVLVARTRVPVVQDERIIVGIMKELEDEVVVRRHDGQGVSKKPQTDVLLCRPI